MILLLPELIVRRAFRNRHFRKEEVKEEMEKISFCGRTPGIKTNFTKQSSPLRNSRSKNKQDEDKSVNSFKQTDINDILKCKFLN